MPSLKIKLVRILSSSPIPNSSEAEAELILFHVARKSFPDISSLSELRLRNPNYTNDMEALAIQLANDRASGKPLQHLTGNQFFFAHEYKVNDSTLIPRPETEILVQVAIEMLEQKFPRQNASEQISLSPPFRFAELGLGSGIISGEILAHFPQARAFASEMNPEAIALASANLSKIVGVDFRSRIDILTPLTPASGFEIFLQEAPFDFIISNPPYLSVDDEIMPDVMQHEPHLALFPKIYAEAENPNYFYENFLHHARRLLKSKGSVFFEVPHERAIHLQMRFVQEGFANTRLIPDLTGRYRVLQAGFENG